MNILREDLSGEPLLVERDGEVVVGVYTTSEHTVHVRYLGSLPIKADLPAKATQIGGSPVQAVATMLLMELADEAKGSKRAKGAK